jgi:hypothetical protein
MLLGGAGVIARVDVPEAERSDSEWIGHACEGLLDWYSMRANQTSLTTSRPLTHVFCRIPSKSSAGSADIRA